MGLDYALCLDAKDVTPFVFAKEDSLKAEKQVIYVGSFYDDKTNQWFDVGEADIDNWVTQFATYTGNGNEVPLPEEHDLLPSARKGTILGLKKKTDEKGRLSLYADVQFKTLEDKNTFSETQVSLYSPPEFRDGTGTTYRRPITHIALTDYPVVPDLGTWKTLAASAVIKKKGKPMLKQLAMSLGLQVAADATDENISEMITARFSQLTKDLVESTEKVTSLSADIEALKTKNEPVEPAPIAAGLLDMAKENRNLKLSRLVESSKISPAVKDKLENIFVKDNQALTLSLSRTDVTKRDVFDLVCEALQDNEVVDMKEKSGAQVLQFSKGLKEGDTPTDNTLTRLADETAKNFNAN